MIALSATGGAGLLPAAPSPLITLVHARPVVEGPPETVAPRWGREQHESDGRTPRISAVMREGEQVTPLELFFDLVFVLALTQCTTLIAAHGDVGGHAQGGARARRAVVVVGRVCVADERARTRRRGLVRLVMFAAMAAFLVAALCVPGAFGGRGAAVRVRLRGGARRRTSCCSCWPAARIARCAAR